MQLWPNWSWNNGAVTPAKDSPEFSAVWAYTPIILYLASKQSSDPQSLAANAPLILDVLTSSDVGKSVTATINESSPTLVEAQIAIPDIPAKDKRPAVTARQITLSLEADSAEPSFTLYLDWGSGRARFSGIKARRVTEGKVVVEMPVDNYKLELGLSRESSGAVVAEFDHEYVRNALSGQSLKLLSMQPMKAALSVPEEAVEQARIEKAAQANGSFVPSGHGASLAAGLRYADETSALYSVGWRFNYAIAGDLVALPLQVQLDYAPKIGMVSGNVGFGVSVTPTSIGNIPVTFSLIPGIRAGAVDVGMADADASAVLGPSVGLSAGLAITPRFQVQLSGEYFYNLLTEAADKGVGSVPSVQLGSVLQF